MNYFFVPGLTTCATSVENPSSINSWVKVPYFLNLYVLCVSSITICNDTDTFIAIYMPGVFSIFLPTVYHGSKGNVAFKKYALEMLRSLSPENEQSRS